MSPPFPAHIAIVVTSVVTNAPNIFQRLRPMERARAEGSTRCRRRAVRRVNVRARYACAPRVLGGAFRAV